MGSRRVPVLRFVLECVLSGSRTPGSYSGNALEIAAAFHGTRSGPLAVLLRDPCDAHAKIPGLISQASSIFPRQIKPRQFLGSEI
jgi:hypothetical protein